MPTLIFKINQESARELEEIRAEAVALARSLENLSGADWRRLQPLFERFFQVLTRVNANLILVDAALRREAPGARQERVQ